MKHLVFLLLLSLFFISCQTVEKPFLLNYLNTGNLPQQSFTINPDADTTLTSSGGVKIRIGKGTFPSGKPVTIEWKEALDFQSILKAGLTTQTGKELLRSGGMFYFNTIEKLDIQKPIGIDVPTETIAAGMQLYKGDSSEGKLDWKDPKPIENVKAFGKNVLGKNLFEENCRRCHKLDQDIDGFSILGYQNRGPWSNKQKLYDFIHNPAGFMASDLYTQCLQSKYGVVMQAFPALSTAEIDSITEYIKDESIKLGVYKEPVEMEDSCTIYSDIYATLLHKRDSLYKINNNTIDVDYGIDTTTQLNVNTPVNIPTTKPDREIEIVSTVERKTDYYRVTIEANGWYNVDALFKDWSGASASKLIVRLQGEYSSKQEFYLAIPSIKVLVPGGYLANGADIGFYEKDGSIPLPLGAKAYVFAIGEENGNFYYSQTNFTIQASQTITLKAEKISKEEFDNKTRKLQMNGLEIKTDPTTQYNSLKSLDDQF